MSQQKTRQAATIRPASLADIPGIFDVRTAVTENAITLDRLDKLGINPASMEKWLSEGSLGGWCAEQSGDIVGFALSDRAEGLIEALFVCPECEGQGLGGQLLERAVEDLRAHGYQVIRLFTGPETRAYSFYRKRGWRPTGERKRSDVEMAWNADAV